MAGELPAMRLLAAHHVAGTLLVGVRVADLRIWLWEMEEVQMRYRPGRVEWRFQDPRIAGDLSLMVVAHVSGDGFTCRLTSTGTVSVFWTYGGTGTVFSPLQSCDPRAGNPVAIPFPAPAHLVAPAQETRVGDDGFCIRTAAFVVPEAWREQDWFRHRIGLADAPLTLAVYGSCSSGRYALAPADEWRTSSGGGSGDLVVGQAHGEQVFWTVRAVATDAAPPAPADHAQLFAAGLEHGEHLATTLDLRTPEAALDTAVAALGAALDATWYPPVFVHGGMAWNEPFPGWRVLFGPTACGWHERVLAEARYYLSYQVQTSDRTRPLSDPARLHTVQAAESRFHGVGRIARHQRQFNFQTQFFDMLAHAWRWNGDADLAAILRPGLELHLQWVRDCFDPEDSGLYESYINTWPTDNWWHAGAKTATETSYAYRGHTTAAALARWAGDADAAQRHDRIAQRIHAAFHERLWLTETGHPAESIATAGIRRERPDASLYSIFLPIDAGLLTPLQAAQALYYTTWALERIATPLGGEVCHTTNWIPHIWSSRELFHGDNYHLALAHFQVGMAEEGLALLTGSCLDSCFLGEGPGVIGHSQESDFNDITSMFARCMVEGLAGFRPDRPNGQVFWTPCWPLDWPQASLRTYDASLEFAARGDHFSYAILLRQPAALVLRFRIRAESLLQVRVDGLDVPFEVQPGFGCSVVLIALSPRAEARIELRVQGRWQGPGMSAVNLEVGAACVLAAPCGRIRSWQDPQDTLVDARLEDGRVLAQIAPATSASAHRLVVALVDTGKLSYWHRFLLKISDRGAQTAQALRRLSCLPPGLRPRDWLTIDCRSAYNGDLRAIFQQSYLSPRPDTVSVQLGSDGFTPWGMSAWKESGPPILDFDRLSDLQTSENSIVVPQGVPFRWGDEARNIAFTSLWDNWPNEVTMRVDATGRALFALLAGSVTHMHTGLIVARLTVRYDDESTDYLDLVAPHDFWAVCTHRRRCQDPCQPIDCGYEQYDHRWPLHSHRPETVELGRNCRANLVNFVLRPQIPVREVTLSAGTPEVVVGLLGLSLLR
jgi:hypothetical protein